MAQMEGDQLVPHLRLMLEVTRECLDDARHTAGSIKRTGCYIDSLCTDWCEMFARET